MFTAWFSLSHSLSVLASPRRWLRSNRARNLATVIVLLGSTAFFGKHLNQVHAIETWLCWSYVKLWGLSLLFSAASFSVGWKALSVLLPAPPRLLERSALAAALGVLLFFLGLYVAGLLNLYNKVVFYAFPCVLLAIGARRWWTDFRRLARHTKHRKVRLFAPKGALEIGILSLFVLALTVVYVPILVPRNVSYDAIWYHLAIAEDYAAAGGIHPFREGWFLGTYPHLASILYTWAFIGPGEFYERVLLCAHLEFVLLLGTLLGVSALASRLAGRRLPYAAVALFLFPGIYVYDSCLSSGADHILAFWTPVIALSLLRFAKNPQSSRDAILSGALVAGAASTKYQACYIVVPAIVFVLFLTARRRRFIAVGAWFFAAGAVSATHWLKNLIYYGDPLYPLLYQWLPSHPFHRDAAAWLQRYYWPAVPKPVGTGWEKVLNALYASLNFSLTPDGAFKWDSHELPLVGSLFTLLIPAMLFLRKTQRLWWNVAGIQLGLFIWYWTTSQERFLQVLTPWMAAVTAALLVRFWSQSKTTRLTLVPLVGLQIVWGADLFTLERHRMNGHAPLHLALEHFASSYDHRAKTRFQIPDSLEHLRHRVKSGARALLHFQRLHLGLGIEIVTDETGWQGGINYIDHESPRNTLELWKRLGVSHVMWPSDHVADEPVEIAREIVFLRAVQQVARPTSLRRDWYFERRRNVEQAPELAGQATRFLWQGCGFDRENGYYTPKSWALGLKERALGLDGLSDPLSTVNAVALKRPCANSPELVMALEGTFERFGSIEGVEIWLRKPIPSRRP